MEKYKKYGVRLYAVILEGRRTEAFFSVRLCPLVIRAGDKAGEASLRRCFFIFAHRYGGGVCGFYMCEAARRGVRRVLCAGLYRLIMRAKVGSNPRGFVICLWCGAG